MTTPDAPRQGAQANHRSTKENTRIRQEISPSISPNLQTCAAELYAALFGTWKYPKRASRMTGRAERKYTDIPTYSFGPEHFDAHLAGHDTYADTLGLLREARSGCKDYDDAGEVEIIAALAAAAAKGITAATFLLPGNVGEHTGGHLWALYERLYPVADIRAQFRTIPRSRKGEDYPRGNPVRIPFGYHKRKRKGTRGARAPRWSALRSRRPRSSVACQSLLASPARWMSIAS
jgi:hypothetical protein